MCTGGRHPDEDHQHQRIGDGDGDPFEERAQRPRRWERKEKNSD